MISMILGLAFAGQLPTEAGLPARPEQIATRVLSYTPPSPADYRSEVAGVPMYVGTSHDFPLVNVRFRFKGGRYLDPEGKTGLGEMTGTLMRTGGTKSQEPTELDEELDFLAANIRINVGDEFSTASVNCLKANLEPCLDRFIEMLRKPRFDEERVGVYVDGQLQGMANRNDDASQVMAREWSALMYGRDHYLGAVQTKAELEAITKKDLKAFSKQLFHPGNLIVSVSGDITAIEASALLEPRMKGWKARERSSEPPAPTHVLEPGVYHAAKDIPQGKVRIGMRGMMRDDDDALAVRLMNEILGQGGFTSRITKRVRSDEGLAYTARSVFANRVEYPGQFIAWTESKSETVALATQIMLEEIERIGEEPVSDLELKTAKAALIETFPQTFESKSTLVAIFADDELTGRPAGYWETYRTQVAKVTKKDVMKAAKDHLVSDELAIFIVGNLGPIAKGDLDGRATIEGLGRGEVHPILLRDPMTDQAP